MADPLTKNGDFHEMISKTLTDMQELQIHVKKWQIKSTIVKFKRGVSQYVEFDSTREKFTNKFTKFVLKTPYIKSYNALKTNRVQTSTRRYFIDAKKECQLKISTYVRSSTQRNLTTFRFELNSRDS